jgi:hypothetical protein
MGGRGSKAAAPRNTETMQLIDQMNNYFAIIIITNVQQKCVNTTCKRQERIKERKYNWRKVRYEMRDTNRFKCVEYNQRCWMEQVGNIDKTTEYMVKTWNLYSKTPEHGTEAERIDFWKNQIEKYMPNLIKFNKFHINPITRLLILKTTERYFDKARTRGLGDNIAVQLEAIQYYIDTVLSSGNPIDKRFMGMLGTLNKSVIHFTLPSSIPTNRDSQAIRERKNDQRRASEKLHELLYNFLQNKILEQYNKDAQKVPIEISNERDFVFFLNYCVKVAEDKEINKYNDGTEIAGMSRESYEDQEVRDHKIFEDVESLKNACKYFLYLYRKKNCSKYIMPNTKEVPNINTYRKCRISGFEPINKPKEEIKRLERSKLEKEEGELSSISDENRSAFESATREKFTNIEKFENNNIFKRVVENLKLVLGYVLVLVLIGCLIVIAPTVFEKAYYATTNYLIPLLQTVLLTLGQTLFVVGKLLITSGEGVIFFVIGIFTTIFQLLKVTFGISIDVLKGLAANTFDSLKTTYKIFTEGSVPLFDIVVSFFNVIVKIITDSGKGLIMLVQDIIAIIGNIITKGMATVVGNISKNIFDNSKKFYMTINNIEE